MKSEEPTPLRVSGARAKRSSVAGFSFGFIALLTWLACEQQVSAPAPTAGAPSVPLTALDADEARYNALRQKLNTYISDCTNRQTEAVYRRRDQMSAWAEQFPDEPVTPQSEPAASLELNPAAAAAADQSEDFFLQQADLSPGGSSLARASDVGNDADAPAPAVCINAVEQAAKIEPHAPELEQAASEYAQALSLVSPLLSETHQARGRRAKARSSTDEGRAIYEKFSSAWDRFDAANQALMQQIQTVKAELDQRTLQRLEREGPEIDYLAKLSLMAAQRLSETGRLELTDPKKLNVTEYLRLVSEYERKLEAMAAFVSHNSPKVNGASVTPYLHESHAFLVSAKALAERVRDRNGQLHAEAPNSKQAPASPMRLLVNFNGVIGAYNAAQHAGGFAKL